MASSAKGNWEPGVSFQFLIPELNVLFAPLMRAASGVTGQASFPIPVVGKAGIIPEGALLWVICPGTIDWIAGILFLPTSFVMAAC